MSTVQTASSEKTTIPLPPEINNVLTAWWLAVGLTLFALVGLSPTIFSLIKGFAASAELQWGLLGGVGVAILLVGALIAAGFAKGRRGSYRFFKIASIVGLLIGLGGIAGVVVMAMQGTIKLGPDDAIFRALVWALLICLPLLPTVFGIMALALAGKHEVRWFFGYRCPQCGSFKVKGMGFSHDKLKCLEKECGHVWPEPAKVGEEVPAMEEGAEEAAEAVGGEVVEEVATDEEAAHPGATVELSSVEATITSPDSLDAILRDEGAVLEQPADEEVEAAAEADMPEAESPALEEEPVAESADLSESLSELAEGEEATEGAVVVEETEPVAPKAKPARKSSLMKLVFLWVLVLGVGGGAIASWSLWKEMFVALTGIKNEWIVFGTIGGVFLLVGLIGTFFMTRTGRRKEVVVEELGEEGAVAAEVTEEESVAVEAAEGVEAEQPFEAIAEEEQAAESAPDDEAEVAVEESVPTPEIAESALLPASEAEGELGAAEIESPDEELAAVVAEEEEALISAEGFEEEVVSEREPKARRKSPMLGLVLLWGVIAAAIAGLFVGWPWLRGFVVDLTGIKTDWILQGTGGGILALIGLLGTLLLARRGRASRSPKSPPPVEATEEEAVVADEGEVVASEEEAERAEVSPEEPADDEGFLAELTEGEPHSDEPSASTDVTTPPADPFDAFLEEAGTAQEGEVQEMEDLFTDENSSDPTDRPKSPPASD